MHRQLAPVPKVIGCYVSMFCHCRGGSGAGGVRGRGECEGGRREAGEGRRGGGDEVDSENPMMKQLNSMFHYIMRCILSFSCD